MWNYIFKRLLFFLPTFFLIFLANFAVLEWMPGGPLNYMQGVLDEACLDDGLPEVTGQIIIPQELQDALSDFYVLDKPLIERFFIMFKKYLTFDLGKSYRTGESVKDAIWARLPVTLFVGFLSFFLLYALAIPIGMLQGYYRGSFGDIFSNFILLILYATPTVIISMLMLILFSTGLITDFFPSGGLLSVGACHSSTWEFMKDYAWHIFLPVVTLVISALARPVYLIKQAVIAETKKGYVHAAMSRGLSQKDIFTHHILKNSLLPVLGYMPGQLGSMLLERPFFVEIIFSFGGLGFLALQSFECRDYTMIFGTLYVFSLLRVVVQLVGDLLATVLDPRVHYEGIKR